MAMSKDGLRDRILSELNGMGLDVGSNGKDNGSWIQRYAQAIANAVVDEITTNAKCNGTDSRGDSHSSVGIV